MTEKRIMKLASRGKRFGAACIDVFVPFVSYLMIMAVLLANGINPYYPGYGYGFGNNFGYGYGYGYGLGYGIGRHQLSGASAVIVVAVAFILIGYTVAELVLFSKGKTIGKAILGLQVVSSTDGKPFRFWKMLFRECFVKSASGSVFALGFIWILIDEKNRGWHDKILDSYVVDLRESERLNYKRHISLTRAAEAEAVPETDTEVRPAESSAAETQPPEEHVTEVSSETTGDGTEMVSEEHVTEVSPETTDNETETVSEENSETTGNETEMVSEEDPEENIAEPAEEDAENLNIN